MNMNYGPGPEGVPNPLHFIVHPYPTRYHGPIYDRPMWNPNRYMENKFTFAAGPDGSMSGFGTMGEEAQSLFSDLTDAGKAAAEAACSPVCEKERYKWGAYGLVVGGGLAWIAWTLTGKR